MPAAAAIRFIRTKALLKRCYVMQAAEVLRTRYVEVPEALLGALKVPTATELQPLLSQLAEVDALKQKGNECAHQSTSFVTEGLLSLSLIQLCPAVATQELVQKGSTVDVTFSSLSQNWDVCF